MSDPAIARDPIPGDPQPEEPATAFERYRHLVPWAVGFSVLTLVVISVYYQTRKGGDILAELSHVQPGAILAALALHLMMQVFWGCRIFVLGRGLGAPTRLPRSLALVTSGLFAAAVTPGRVGGEPWRIAMLVRGGASGAAGSRTIVADRAVDMLFFLAMGATAIAVLPAFFGDADDIRALGLVALFGLLGIMVVIGLLLVRPGPMSRTLSKAANLPARVRGRPTRDRAPAIAAFFADITGGLRELLRRRPSILLASAGLSVALWTCELSILWVVLRGFGFDPPFSATYLAGVLVVMVGSVPGLPGGTGLAEVTALALLTRLAPGLTPAFLVVWRGMTYYVDLLLGGTVAGLLARRKGSGGPPG